MGSRFVGAARRVFRWDYRMDPRIAWLPPMPPAKTGIATYSKAVLQGLDRIGYTAQRHRIRPIWPVEPRHEPLDVEDVRTGCAQARDAERVLRDLERDS